MADFNYQEYLASREWALLREQVRQRGGGMCERCYLSPQQSTHHKTYERIGHELLTDLLGVCRECHAFLSAKSDYDPTSESAKAAREAEWEEKLKQEDSNAPMQFAIEDWLGNSKLQQFRYGFRVECPICAGKHQSGDYNHFQSPEEVNFGDYGAAKEVKSITDFRGSCIRIPMWCENEHHWSLIVAFHKGHTLITCGRASEKDYDKRDSIKAITNPAPEPITTLDVFFARPRQCPICGKYILPSRDTCEECGHVVK